MQQRVRLELGDRSPAEVLELVVHNCRSSDGEVEGLTEEYKELEFLSMVSSGLSSLARLPALPRLCKLELGDNSIGGGLDVLVEKCPNLTNLNLSRNKIKDLKSLEVLKGLKGLQRLELFSCEVAALEGYRGAVFRMLPQISFLDGFDQDDNEAPDSEDEDEDGGPTGDQDDDEDSDEDGSEGEEEVGLSYLMKGEIQDEEDDDDYVEEEDEEEEDGEEGGVQGEKRKRDPEDDGDDDEDDD